VIGFQGDPENGLKIKIFMMIGPSWFHDLRKMMDSLKKDKKDRGIMLYA
jgi:hypothetical protein